MLHLIKLAAGVSDVEDLRARQAEHAMRFPPLHHRTRQFPRRTSDLLEGGSIYWVIGGFVLVRQAIADIVPGTRYDGSACAELRINPDLICVAGRRVKAFQGWRYLAADQVPADIKSDANLPNAVVLPDGLRKELMSLCLL